MKARMVEWKELARKNKSIVELHDSFRRESIAREEEKRKAENTSKLLEKVPVRFRDKIFNDYITECAQQARTKTICERFVTTFQERIEQGTCIRFLGNPGTGKTLLSLIMYQSLAKSRFSVQYESSLQFLKIIQEKRYESNAAYQNILSSYIRPQLLILDEATESISKDGFPSEYERKLLFEVINARYEMKNCCTLVISNRDQNEMINRLGQPITDRLSENGITLIFNWNSYRQK